MNLNRKLPIVASAMIVVLCMALVAAAVIGMNRTMSATGSTVNSRLSELVADQMVHGAEREREQVVNLLDIARRQVVAVAQSPSALSALRGDRDEQVKKRVLRPVSAGTLELGRAVQTQIDQLVPSLDVSLSTMRHLMEQGGAWSLDGDPITWQTVDQHGESATVPLIPLAVGGTTITVTDDPAVPVPQVDVPAALTRTLVTIFQRGPGDRMVRIATNVMRDGKRAIGTAIVSMGKDGVPNPVLAEVLAGRPFRGLAWVVDRWCVTAYHPVISDGVVIGMVFAGQPVLDLPGLTESIRRQRIGSTGYAVLVDASGRLILHPKPDLIGKHLLDDLHIEGFRPMLDAPADGTIGTCWYVHEGREKFGCFFKMPTWKWAVLATGFADEVGAELIAQAKATMADEMGQLYRTTAVAVENGQAAPLFSQIRLLDHQGTEVISLRDGKSAEVGKRRVDAPWFATALGDRSGTGLMHPLQISVNTQHPELRITTPVRHGNEVAGVLAVNLDWSLVQRAIGGHRYGKTGYPWIVNKDGILVTHPTYTLGDNKSLVAPAMGELGERIRQVLAAGEVWHGFYSFEGFRKYSAMLPMNVGAERWVIATTGPANELLEPVEDMEAEMRRGRSNLVWLLLAVSLTVAIVGVLGAVWYVRRLMAPILRTERVLDVLAQGDLTGRLALTSNDEFGRMAKALDSGLGALGGALGGVGRNAQGIAGAAEELTAVSTQLTSSASTVATQAGQAAAAVTQVSSSIQTCASGIEEMSASVGEIAQSAGQAASVAQEGVAAVREADATMARLGTSSAEIGDIVKLITGIAEQTNLLALNATIEAARAGDMGRGFAVVAGEVKALARQTSEATADIGQRVTAIQGDAISAQAALHRISDIVAKIHTLQTTIAAAVEEQSATTKEIGGNLHQVANAGSEITRSVTAVADAAKESSVGASETLKAASELSRLANELRTEIGRFRT